MQSSTALEAVLKRDRMIVLTGLTGITALAWAYIGYLAWDMGHMDMSMGMAMPHMQTWGAMDLVLLCVMWAVMMVAMMVPSAARPCAPGSGQFSVDPAQVYLPDALPLAFGVSDD